MGRRLAVIVLAGAFGGCGSGGGDAETLNVFAASSLTDAFGDIEDAFEADHPEVDVVLNLAASSALREQILAGAPADVFASANAANVDELVDAGDVAGVPVDFATTDLVIAVADGNPGAVTGLADFARDDLLLGLCAPQVPCGELARAALAAAAVDASLDTEEPDVRSLLDKIESGELDAGIVYRTDISPAASVVALELPADVEAATSASYRIVAVTDGAVAADFVAFVLGTSGQALLADHGFGRP